MPWPRYTNSLIAPIVPKWPPALGSRRDVLRHRVSGFASARRSIVLASLGLSACSPYNACWLSGGSAGACSFCADRFWLFVSGGRFVARSCQANVQVFGDSPREAVHGLRTALRQSRRQYGLARCEREPRAVRPAPCRGDLECEFNTQVMQCLYVHGFWGGAARFAELAAQHLAKDRRLPAEARSEAW